MSIAAFYRTEVVFTRSYSYYLAGRAVKKWAGYAYTKANIQPWKAGEQLQTGGGGVYFSEYSIIYIKDVPKLPPPHDIPVGTEVEEGELLVWVEDSWHKVSGNQNWRRAGRGPKHRKLQIIRLPSSTPEGDIPPNPDTSLRSVEEMTNNTYELEQVVITLGN